MANKSDIWKDNLSDEKTNIINEFKRDLEQDNILEMSTKDDEESVVKVKIDACEILLQHRVEQKFRTKKVNKTCDQEVTNYGRTLVWGGAVNLNFFSNY